MNKRAPFATVSHWGILSYSQDKGTLLLLILEATTPRSFLSSVEVKESLTRILLPPNLRSVITEKSKGVNITSLMPRKWKVQVVSQKHSIKARSNWRSLYSCVSWFNKVSKKVPKPASLVIFFMLGDNGAHALFNIWRLSRLLRLYNRKVQLINFHDQDPHD